MKNNIAILFLKRIRPAFLFISLIWLVFLVEQITQVSFVTLGVYPRTVKGLIGIFAAPLVHGGLKHIFYNSVSLLTLMSLLFYAYKKQAKEVFIWIYFLSGAYVWVFARASYHIGASGVVYGLIGFVVLAGILSFNRRLLSISLLVIVINAGFIWGIFPLEKGVSWESHLSGLMIGMVLAVFFRKEFQKKREKPLDKEPVSWTSSQFETFSYTYKEEEKNSQG